MQQKKIAAVCAPLTARGRFSLWTIAASVAFAFASMTASPEVGAQVVVSVAATDAEAAESPPNNGQFTITRTGGNSIQTFTVSYEVTGSATPGADYTPLSGSASFTLFQSTANIPVNVTGDDGLFEGDETVTIRLLPSGSVSVTNDTATVTIRDTPHSVTVAAGSDADEGSLTAGEIIVSLDGENRSGNPITVSYSTGGTATPDSDYTALSGTASIPVAESSASIAVTPVADDLFEGDETVEVTLTGTSDSRLPVGNPDGATVAIVDDDALGDYDDDGLSNIAECPDVPDCPDTDGDGVPNWQDPDDDGDGVPTEMENPPDQDTDGDGVPDYLDDDDDGDGILTRDEDLDEDGDGNPATDPTDSDGDGIPDYLDTDNQDGPAGDLDGDGLSNEREAELGTDPLNPDTDGDGVSDGDEIDAGTDPLDDRSFTEADGDLVPDAVELRDGTDPHDATSFLDSDGGGTPDHVETVVFASHDLPPTDIHDHSDDWRDSDGDGLPDRLEILIGSDPVSADSPTPDGAGDTGNGVSNAVEAWLSSIGMSSVDATSDFDRDGYPDVMEVAFGMNPLSAEEKDSDGDGVPDVIEALAGLDIDPTTDSDGDGVPDAREIALGSDPLDANSPVANGAMDDDNDGVSNAIEHVVQVLGGPADITADTDTDGDGVTDADEIRGGLDPLHNAQPVTWIELRQSEIGPVLALSSEGGTATATARVGGHQGGSLLFDWGGSDNAVLAVVSGGRTGRSLTFSPATLPPGTYRLALTVERTAGDFTSEGSTMEFVFSVLDDVEADEIADSDSDGIADAADDSDARFEFPHRLQSQTVAPLQADSGVRLRVGTVARVVRANSPRISLQDIANAGDGNGGSVANGEDNFEYVGGLYDFEITNLPQAGASVRIVIPQGSPVGEVPEYRKFRPGPGWTKFVEDESNRVESAAGSSSSCPDPGDAAWQPGLTPGHSCVQLTIEDGGPNDADGNRNGIVRDPGGVATPKGEVSVGQGGGSIGLFALLVLAPVAWFGTFRREQRTRRGLPTAGAGLLLCACLVALPTTARADVFVGVGAGLSFLDPDTAETPFSVEDDQDTGMKVFAGVDLSPISRNLSVEAFWADLGEATLDNNGRVDYSLFGAGLSYGIGSVRAPRLSGFLKAGVARLDANANVPFVQQDETLMFFGIAGSFAIQRHWFLQLEYEYFAEDAQFLSLNIVKRFRTRTSADARTMPLPDR